MSDDGEDPLNDGSDDAESNDENGPTDVDPVDEWVETVASDAERDHPGEDPFERIGEGSGPRHGDPFDAFEDPEGAPSEGEEGHSDATDAAAPSRDGLPSGTETDDPFATFDAPTSDPFEEGQTVFDGEDRGGLGEDVWERMESTDPEAEAAPGKRYVDVNKHSYCETCKYFSAPPDVACSHEGTDILEFVDVETIRVVDCPVVDERNALEDVD